MSLFVGFVFLLIKFTVITLTKATSDGDEIKFISDNNFIYSYDNNTISINNINNLNHVDRKFKRAAVSIVQSSPIKLIDKNVCPEIRNLCSNLRSGSDDLFVLECVQTFLTSQIEALSDECHHAIWTHTLNLMSDQNIQQVLSKNCDDILEKFNCKLGGGVSSSKPTGQLLACILDHKDNIENPGCRGFVQRLEWVAFSDFRLIGTFVRDCEQDIELNTCGRLTTDRQKLSQGETLACLQNHIDKLSKECRKGILHLSELQGDNMRLDRKLFLGCKQDAMVFCSDLRPGTGAVYKCLLKHKENEKMSRQCHEQLLRRDKLIAHDYKVSKGLVRACKEDIKIHHCRRGVSEDKEVRLAQILLCLESAHKNNSKITAECLAEMSDHRKLLMEDFQLSPEVLSGCSDDIVKFCGDNSDGTVIGGGNSLIIGGGGAGAKTIHCLMDYARPKQKKDKRLTTTCLRALEMLIKVSDAGEDWRVDPVLRNACKPVVDVACHDTESGDARVISCLMEKLGTNYMTTDCETALLQIQYFIARDFKLDPQLYRNCKDDAVQYCHAKKEWADIDNFQNDPERGPLILPCLHRIAYNHMDNVQLKPKCFQEVKRVMRQRATSVDLIPEVEDECLNDLAVYCFDKTEKGVEMQCLQDNLEKLEDKCKTAVVSYTEDEAGHIELNPIIMLYCSNAMEKYCANILKTGNDEGDIMECLIVHKNDPDLRQDVKCRAAIEHFQLISLKNYHFTYKFKEACRSHVIRFCPNSKTKYDVVTCLSEVMRNDTLKGQRQTIPKECRQQVRAQLYQQRENIDFDPELKKACKEEINRNCGNIPHGAGQVLECLQTHQNKLSRNCKHILFNRKVSEMTDSATDYTLMNTCKDMIRQYCHDMEHTKLLQCLKMHKDEPLFDTNCHSVIVNRMIEQNIDYRFNPSLQESCAQNIGEFCSEIVALAKPNEELNGKMINCLKHKFREGKLTKTCEKKMTEILHEQALNYKLNPLLQTVCKFELEFLCKPSEDDNIKNEDNGIVVECLKNAFLNNRIKTPECKLEVAILIEETKADIHVDPLLQRACIVDLLKYCSNVESGNGRQLKCLYVILDDKTKSLEDDCKTKLEKRIEMFRNAAPIVLAQAPEDLHELYSQVLTSPSRKYFIVLILTFLGFIFIAGLFCGRVTRRTAALKNK